MRLAGTVLVLAATTAAALAQEKAAAPGESAISAAAREFEAVKAARDPAPQPKAGLPTIAVPEFHSPTAMPEPRLTPQEQLKKQQREKKRAANWLVDAMRKKNADVRDVREGRDGRDGRRMRAKGSERFSDSETDELLTPGERETVAGLDEEATAETRPAREEPPPAVVNPLTQFLGDWMTPQDYALLKPGLERSIAETAERSPTMGLSPFAPGDLATASAPAIFGVGPANSSAMPAPAAPRENPYLDLLNRGPATTLGALTPPVSNVAPAPPPSVSVAPAPMPAPMSQPQPPAAPTISDFVKRTGEEKYYKPLKRF